MKKLVHCAILGAALMPALACASTDLHVTGRISAAACTPSVTGDLAYGSLIPGSDGSAPQTLESKFATLTITCGGPSAFAWRLIDSRDGTAEAKDTDRPSVGDANAFGLGESNGQKVGMYLVEHVSARADERVVKLGYRDGASGTAFRFNDQMLALISKERVHGHARNADAITPDHVSSLAAELKITPYVRPMTLLEGDDAVRLDGLATVELVAL